MRPKHVVHVCRCPCLLVCVCVCVCVCVHAGASAGERVCVRARLRVCEETFKSSEAPMYDANRQVAGRGPRSRQRKQRAAGAIVECSMVDATALRAYELRQHGVYGEVVIHIVYL